MKITIRRFLAALLAVMLIPVGGLRADTPSKQSKQGTSAAADAGPKLTLEAISRDPGKWMGTAPGGIRWSEDGSKLYFNWNPERADRSDLYELDVRTAGAKPRKVADAEKRWLS